MSVSTRATGLSTGGVGTHEIVEARRDASEAEPGVAGDKTFQISRSRNVEIVPADDAAHELGIFLHHHRGKIEPAVGDLGGLLLQAMMRQLHVQAAQVWVVEQLAHEIRRA